MKTQLTILAVSTALTVPSFAQQAGSRDARGQLEFEGRFLVSVQDADMVSSAYVNGMLGPREGADTLEWELSSPPPYHQWEQLPKVK